MLASKGKGFTLVELVTVILILGIVSVGISGFVVMGTRIFVDSSLTDQVLSESRFALQRMTRELKAAMPNSIRLTTNGSSVQCIEFVPTITSTSYIDLPLLDDTARDNGKIFRNGSGSKMKQDQRIYVAPSSVADVYERNDHFAILKSVPTASTVSTESGVLDMVFKQKRQFAEASPSKRAYFVEQPVSFCFKGIEGELHRFSGYGYSSVQSNFIGQNGSVVARNIANNLSDPNDLPIDYEPSTLQSNAIVQLNPRFTIDGQTIQYQHQVQVINVP